MTITEAADLLRAGRVSSAELVRDALNVIERRNPALNAFITVIGDSALHRAEQLDQRRRRGDACGVLCGIPIALKDVFRTRGVRTTAGSRIFADHVPDFDSAVTERLEAAGAVLIGKTGLHELAYGITSQNPHFGAIHNPWNPDRIPGGSSGGSGAAVAAGMVFAAMGTDTGGSIRIPASFCGCVGLKPTSGRVSRYGVMPLDWSLDHVGPLTRSVRDAALLLEVIAGRDDRDDTSSRRPAGDYIPLAEDASLEGVRIGWPENFFFERINPAVAAAMSQAQAAAQSLGAEIVSVQVPDIGAINVVGRIILMCEASSMAEPFRNRREEFGEDVRLLLDAGRLIAATDYINAQRHRRRMQREFAAVWKSVDCLVTPAAPITAPAIGATTVAIDGTEEDVRLASTRFARCWNVLGLPAISIPGGFDAEGMPIGVQIVAPAFAERRLLLVGAALEQALRFGFR